MPKKIRRSPAPRKSKPLLTVGIGASAGGYEAFSQLLEKLSPVTEMAFVLVQHLDPTHESRLSELLRRSTPIPVTEITDETVVESNHIYVIPPNRALTISHGVLRLEPRRRGGGPNLPIDQFFESLAVDQGKRAVGIILSGNGIDGTRGLSRIKAQGGITFVQDERTAKFYGMPGNALRAGCVDFVLPPAAMAGQLERLLRAPLRPVRPARKPAPHLPGTETDLTRILDLVRALTGVDFSHYKPSTLNRRITRRMMLKKIATLRDYHRYLQQDPAEVDLLFREILINVTGFFRDPAAFAALGKKVFPRLLRQKPAGSPLRIWVPGCSTGEEVYSLAICLHEFLGANASSKAMQIFGTDISEAMVSRARLGIYPESISSQVAPERLRRYFHKTDRGYQISKFVRDACIFARQNVAADPPFSRLDLISCRNLLIYLGPELQKKVMPIFHYSLRPGGYLLLGTSESIGSHANLFTLVDKRNKIYCKIETGSRPEIEFPPAHAGFTGAKAFKENEEFSYMDLQRRADEILLSKYAPAGVVVNSRMEVLHFRGRTGNYLEPSPGTASLNLLKIVREELTVDIRTAFAQALKSNVAIRTEPVRLRSDGRLRQVGLEVVPFKSPPSPEQFFLVLFHDLPAAPDQDPGRKPSSASVQQTQRDVRRLRQEIAQTRQSLQAIIEEQEATNEELKSANEEIQSSNEELQSTNEELETAKEELQSANEELTTLNEELQNRNVELSQANNDLSNLISSFDMPMLMLDQNLSIRRFTPAARKLFNLIPGDVGRRISDINPNISVPKLDKIVSEVMDSLAMREMEVHDKDGGWYLLRVRPYRTTENKIEGAVLVLIDIGDLRLAIDELTEMASDPMLILDDEFRVRKANGPFYERFGLKAPATVGKSIFELGEGRWNIPALKTLLERILPENKRIENYRIEHEFPVIGRRILLLSARRLYQQRRGTHYIVMRFGEAAPIGPRG